MAKDLRDFISDAIESHNDSRGFDDQIRLSAKDRRIIEGIENYIDDRLKNLSISVGTKEDED